jgi:hypothetical protein
MKQSNILFKLSISIFKPAIFLSNLSKEEVLESEDSGIESEIRASSTTSLKIILNSHVLASL